MPEPIGCPVADGGGEDTEVTAVFIIIIIIVVALQLIAEGLLQSEAA